MLSHLVFLFLRPIQDPCGTQICSPRIGRPVRDAESFSFRETIVERWKKSRIGECASFLKWKRNEFCLNRHASMNLAKKAHQAFQGKFAAQTRSSEAQAETEERGEGEMLVSLFVQLADSSNSSGWNSIRQTVLCCTLLWHWCVTDAPWRKWRTQKSTMDVKRGEDWTLRTTATTKVANGYGCSTCYSRNVPSRSCRRLKQARVWKCDVRNTNRDSARRWTKRWEMGVILALAPPQAQHHSHLNSPILKSYAQVRTMLFEECRAQADTAAGYVVPVDLSTLGEAKGKKGKCDKKGKGQVSQKRQYHAKYSVAVALTLCKHNTSNDPFSRCKSVQ